MAEIAPISLRYGALDYIVYRNRDDQYKFMQCATWASKAEWEAYWYGPEMTTFKTVHSGWYQVPVLYTFADIVASGSRDGNPHHDVVTSGTPTTGDAQAS